MNHPMQKNQPRGAIAILALLGMAVFALAMLGTMAVLASSEGRMSLSTSVSERVYQASEGGLQRGLYQLTKSTVPQTLTFADGTVQTDIVISQHIDPYNRNIDVISTDVPSNIIRKLHVVARTNAFSAPLNYAVQSGRGGIDMYNGAEVIGPVYSNGNIRGENNSEIQGDLWVAQGTPIPYPPLGAPNGPSQTTTPATFDFGDNPSRMDVAQQFLVPTDEPLQKVRIHIRRTGNLPDAEYAFRIVEDDGTGKPSTVKIIEKMIPKNDFPNGSADWMLIDFGIGPLLQSGQPYWMVLNTTTSDARHLVWGRNTNDASYPDGTAQYSLDAETGPWNPAGGDLAFETYFGIGSTYLDNVDVTGNVSAYELKNNPTISGSKECMLPLGTCPSWSDPGRKDYAILDSDIANWVSDASTNSAPPPGYTSPGDYTVNGTVSMGPAIIDGNLTLAGSAHLIVTGNIYVTKNITFDNPGIQISVSPALGPESKSIISDGTIDVRNNATILGSGNPKSYLMMLSRNNSLLYKRNISDTDRPAIFAASNADAVLFFAPRGLVQQWNNSELNGTTGYVVRLEQQSRIQYDPNLQGFTIGSSNPQPIGTVTGSWGEL